MSTIEARRAAVRPRVQVSAGGVPRLLEEEVADLLRQPRALVWLVGEDGAGKSTALAHLAAVFAGETRLRLHDGAKFTPGAEGVDVVALPNRLASFVAGKREGLTWRLSAWTDDDCLEYLRVSHPQRVGPAFAAWRAGTIEHDLLHWPGVCSAVLDELAAETGPADVWQALQRVVARLPGGELPAMRALQWHFRDARANLPWLIPVDRIERSLLRSRTARGLLAAARLTQLAKDATDFAIEGLVWSHDLALAVKALMQHDAEIRHRLIEHVQVPDGSDRRLALSLLAIAQPGFRPPARPLQDLANAWLASADLSGLTLGGGCRRVHLSHAALRGATLDGCELQRASLRRANLCGATLVRAVCTQIDGRGLMGDDVDARGADFGGAHLRSASLRRANLAGSRWQRADLADADLSHADLGAADLSGLDLRATRLASCRLQYTNLRDVLAPSVTWDALDALGADWSGADLTGSRLSRARLARSSFRSCGLADIDWQGADLTLADFRGASFHLGNARSGLVGSAIASEGSRTGFYTDESREQHFQVPETVRKANLCDTDLRAANLQGVDLYLVDLRGALLNPEQRDWARRCRAILDPA